MVPGKMHISSFKAILAICFGVIFQNAVAQNAEGLVMNNGDTVFCEYILKGNFISVKNAGSAARLVDTREVQSVFSNNNKYTVLFLKLETFSDNPDEIFDPVSKNRSEYDTTLLLSELYSTPKLKLYSATDKRRVKYYFVKKPQDNQPAQLLIRYSVYYAKIGEVITWGSPNLTIQRIYIDQLKGLMADCTRLTAGDFDVVDYRDYSLKKIIKKYSKRCR
jgi:hypothetical protein